MNTSDLFWSNYRARVQQLLRPLRPSDGYSEQSLADAEPRLGVALPRLLREFYRFAGKRDDINHSLHRLLPPEYLYLEGDVLVFYEENQNVCLWGVHCRTMHNRESDGTLSSDDIDLNDPAVVCAENVEPLVWKAEFDRLSQFFTVMLFLQASSGGMRYSGVGRASLENITRAAADWGRVTLGGSGKGDVLLREGEMLYLLAATDEAVIELFAGTKTRKRFLALEQAFDISWDYCTLDDE